MTVTAQTNQQAQAAEVRGKMAAIPELAAPILELLLAAGDDPGKLEALTSKALEQVKAELPSGAEPAAKSISADQILERFGAAPATAAKLMAHGALVFSLTLPAEQVVQTVLAELLSKNEAKQLLGDWRAINAKLSKTAPCENVATFFPESNCKWRLMQNADFKAAGLSGFADDLQATLVCAALVRKARDAGIDLTKSNKMWEATATAKLKPEELNLLIKLCDGIVRTSSGALCLDDYGQLRADYCVDDDYEYFWAAGAAPAAE